MSLTVYVALALGGLCILAVLVRYLRGFYEIKDMSVGLFGVLLIGMVIFNKIGLKVGPDGTFETTWDGSVFATSAESNARIQTVIDNISKLDEKITALASVTPAAEAKVADIEKQNQPSPDLAENSAFTVLVFYRDQQRDKAGKLLDALLRAGFKATSVATDLTEAVQQYDPGTSWIVWSEGAKTIKDRVKNIVSAAAPGAPIEVRDVAYDLKRGNVQILLF